MDAPECRIIELADVGGWPTDIPPMTETKAFVLRRFDRNDYEDRIHIEDFNQVYRQYPNASTIITTTTKWHATCIAWMEVEALQDFVRRLVFTIAIGNTDMHRKN